MKKKKLVSVAEYASMCGITIQGVFNRVKAGSLEYAGSDPVLLIDIDKYPAGLIKLGRKPFRSNYSK